MAEEGKEEKSEPTPSSTDELSEGQDRRGAQAWIGWATEAATGERGVVAAAAVYVPLLLGLVAIGHEAIGGVRWIGSLLDSGPSEQDIKVNVKSLSDGSSLGQETRFLLHYGDQLPEAGSSGYCAAAQDAFRAQGETMGATVVVVLQNTYRGEEPAGVQVSDIRVKVIRETAPSPGVTISCQNSGGDTPVTGFVKAVNEALLTEHPWAPDWESIRWSEWSGAGAPTSFVLDQGEQQQINVSILPGATNRSVDLIADMVANGKIFSKQLNKSPIEVPSDAAASPIVVTVTGSPDPSSPNFDCTPWKTDGKNLCLTDQLFTKQQEEAALGTP